MRITRVILVYSAGLLLFGCLFPGEPDQGRELGISRTESGAIAVLYKPCISKRIQTVQLLDQFGAILGDEDDRVLWEIRALEPYTVLGVFSFTIGQAPEGFNEVVPLTFPLMRSLGIRILTDRQTASEVFQLGELKIGLYLNHRGDYLTNQEFSEFNTCKR